MRINVFLWKLRVKYWIPIKYHLGKFRDVVWDRLLYYGLRLVSLVVRDSVAQQNLYCEYVSRSYLAMNRYMERCICSKWFEDEIDDPCGFCGEYCAELEEEEDW